jgi:phosphoglycerate dehydrogenase-like enzyme
LACCIFYKFFPNLQTLTFPAIHPYHRAGKTEQNEKRGIMKAVLVTRKIADGYGARILAAGGAGTTLVVMHDDGSVTGPVGIEAVEMAFMSYDVMGAANKISTGTPLGEFTRLLDAGTALRWVHVCSAGSDRPVLQRLMQRGVLVTTSSGANAHSVAHTALAGLLALVRDVPWWVTTREQRVWSRFRDVSRLRDIDGMRVGIVGTGPIGATIAHMCRALGMSTIGFRRKQVPLPEFDEMFTLADLSTVAPSLDWLILACPLTAQTKNLVNAQVLAALPADAGLVNVARGEVVDEPALFAALEAGHLYGVYSDVFVDEPPLPDSPWWTAPRVLMSGHYGGVTTGLPVRATERFLSNLELFVRGETMVNLAEPVAGLG